VAQYVNNLVATFAADLGGAVAAEVERAAGQGGALGAAITYLWQEPGVGIEGLRTGLDLSQPATVRLVNQLVATGLASRTPDGQDGRRVSIRLTAAGKARALMILRRRDDVVEEFLTGLSQAQRQQLAGLIARSYAGRRGLTRGDAEHVCRLCDIKACPSYRCPVEAAIEAD
jgi:DNA-binding MarR family transcriptional regulator